MNIYKYIGYIVWWMGLALAGYAGFILNFWILGVALISGLVAQALIRKEEK